MTQNEMSAAHASGLLRQADQAAAAAKRAASWPAIATLLLIGASSSFALVLFAYVPEGLAWLPLTLLMAWFAVGLLICLPQLKSVKQGFGRRWLVTMAIWGVTWCLAIVGSSTIFVGQLWFLLVASFALAAVTVGGALAEIRK